VKDAPNNLSRVEWIALGAAATAVTFGMFLIWAALFWLIDHTGRRLDEVHCLAVAAWIDATLGKPSPWKATVSGMMAYLIAYPRVLCNLAKMSRRR